MLLGPHPADKDKSTLKNHSDTFSEDEKKNVIKYNINIREPTNYFIHNNYKEKLIDNSEDLNNQDKSIKYKSAINIRNS